MQQEFCSSGPPGGSTTLHCAIADTRARTLEQMPLPDGESFTAEYVNNKSGSGYNWYRAATAA